MSRLNQLTSRWAGGWGVLDAYIGVEIIFGVTQPWSGRIDTLSSVGTDGMNYTNKVLGKVSFALMASDCPSTQG